nr:methyltransferase domain-containing protein [Marinomonas ostreistagni]
MDNSPLTRHERTLICANGHAFDMAKTGYINLLPVQNKHSKDPGDSKAMVQSRRAFLAQGHYDPIVTAIIESMPDALKQRTDLNLLDAGCGEGHYLRQLVALLGVNHQVDATGLDISKWAVAEASKRAKEIDWIVGSNAHLPIESGRFDWVMCAFGFPVFEEFARVLDTSGWLLLVESGPDHLLELRKILYPAVKPFKETYANGIEGFDLQHKSRCTFRFHLPDQDSIGQLLSMTPHIHKAPYSGRQAAQALEQLELTADISLRWYQKQGNE